MLKISGEAGISADGFSRVVIFSTIECFFEEGNLSRYGCYKIKQLENDI